MTHDYEKRPESEFDDKRNTMIGLIGMISLLAVVVAFVVGDQYFRRAVYKNIKERRLSVENPDLVDLRTQERILLESYAWVDEGTGVVRIPIERAMELTAREAVQ